MKALIVGYGSMGRRRIRLLQKLVDRVEIITVDSNPERQKQAEEVGIRAFDDLKTAIMEKPDIAFVCTSPGHHAEILLALVDAGINVFTELNIAAACRIRDILSVKKGISDALLPERDGVRIQAERAFSVFSI